MTIIELDDWGTVAELALPLIEKYGPVLWSWIKDKWNGAGRTR
jgi:hypothetical protein